MTEIHVLARARAYISEMGGLSDVVPMSFGSDDRYRAMLEEVRHQHPHDPWDEQVARAQARYLLPLCKPAPMKEEAPHAEAPHINLSPVIEFQPVIREIRRWAIAILILLGLLLFATVAHAQIDGYQIQDGAGAVVKHWGGGVVKVKCGANLTCSFASSVLTITAGAGGATAWDAITIPTVNLSLDHAAFTTTFTWNATTGAGVGLFTLRDTASNTGTGCIFCVNSATGSATFPVQFTAGGTANGVRLSTAGLLGAIGTGGINATQFLGVTTVDATEFGFLNGVTSAIQTQIDAKQALDADLTALAALSTTGLVARTAADTYVPRTIIGSTNEVVVSNGDGVAGNPTLTVGSLVVQTDQANTYSTGAQDFGAATSVILTKAAGAAPTADGSIAYDTTQDAWKGGGAGAVSGAFPRVLYMTNCTTEGNCTTTNEVDADSGQQGTTETNFASNWSMPANFLVSGKAIQVCAALEFTTSGSAPNHVIALKLGATQVVAFAAAGVNSSNSMTSRGSSYCWIIQGTAAPGASVSVEANYAGTVPSNSAANLWNSVDQPVGAIATNGALTVQISGKWITATTGNTMQLHQMYVLELN